MSDRRFGRAVFGGLAAALGVVVVSLPAPAGRGTLDLLTYGGAVADGSTIGLGGDGSAVFFSSRFSDAGSEDPILADDLLDKPFLANNVELFRWDVDVDAVRQVTATSNIENTAGDAVASFTHNDQPSVDSRTLDLYADGNPVPTRQRTVAVAFRSNADQEIPGPSTSIDDVNAQVRDLGATGDAIYVWDSERKSFDPVQSVFLSAGPMSLGNPSLAMRSRSVLDRVKSQEGQVPVSLSIKDVLVAFSGDADLATDNADGNQEIFLWSRKSFLEDGAPGGGGLRNGGITQITHTVQGEEPLPVIGCSSPAVNRSGDVAFLSTADITGENADNLTQLFVWSRGRTRQISRAVSGSIGAPRWSGDGRLLVFDATADLARGNPDLSREVFTWDGRRIRQITEGTIGNSWGPSTDTHGRRIAFVSDANLAGAAYPSDSAEVMVASRRGALTQITFSDDDMDNEAPVMTESKAGTDLTWISSSNLDGRNSNNARRIYRTRIAGR